MTAPERWDLECTVLGGTMTKSSHGDYVHWDDYAAALARIAELEAERDEAIGSRAILSEMWSAEKARATAAEERAERMAEALRLIELLGYREGEELGWIVAHMRGVANDALEGRTSEHIWRLFPRHRAALTEGETPTAGPSWPFPVRPPEMQAVAYFWDGRVEEIELPYKLPEADRPYKIAVRPRPEGETP